MTRLTVAIHVHDTDTDQTAALARAVRAAEHGAEMIEFRVDTLADRPEAVVELVARCGLPCVVTCRHAEEGGQFADDEAQRIVLYRALLKSPTPPAYLDLELMAYQRDPAWRSMLDEDLTENTGLILSTHDFEQRPADLFRRIADMADAPEARVIKAAWMARSLRDNVQAMDLIAQAYKPTIALCMGPFGLPSRVLAKKFGGLLTFAALDPDAATAPGQPTLDELKNLYRWDALGPATKVYGVIGHPVGHSLSPHIHNAGFTATGHDGVYLPLPIPPEYEHFKATVSEWLAAEELDFRGASVTIPHKQSLLRFVQEHHGTIEPLADKIGAANTLTVDDDGKLTASNSDYAAALDAVCDGLAIQREGLAGKRVAVIGAGGAARAIVAGFAHYGATVAIHNRTKRKAEDLAAAFADEPGTILAASLDDLAHAQADVYINATPIGMHPNVDASPMPPEAWHAQEKDAGELPGQLPGELPGVVFDTIYNPLQTKLLRDAAAAGCRTIPGTEMFVRQAAAQFTAWTGQDAPLDVFRSVMLHRLGHEHEQD